MLCCVVQSLHFVYCYKMYTTDYTTYIHTWIGTGISVKVHKGHPGIKPVGIHNIPLYTFLLHHCIMVCCVMCQVGVKRIAKYIH